MPGSPDDKLTTVRKGVKSLFRSRSQRRGTQGSEDAPSSSSQGGGIAVEAPNSTATPQLTTSIPGASLGADLAPTQPRDVPGANQSREPPPPPPIIPRHSYAQGMSATSGPLGGSLEEVEEFEKLQERRASVRSQDASMAAAAAAATRKVGQTDKEAAKDPMDIEKTPIPGQETSDTTATAKISKPTQPDRDADMTDA